MAQEFKYYEAYKVSTCLHDVGVPDENGSHIEACWYPRCIKVNRTQTREIFIVLNQIATKHGNFKLAYNQSNLGLGWENPFLKVDL